MKIFFWVYGGLTFVSGCIPSQVVSDALDITKDTAIINKDLSVLIGIVALGIGCILHEIQKRVR